MEDAHFFEDATSYFIQIVQYDVHGSKMISAIFTLNGGGCREHVSPDSFRKTELKQLLKMFALTTALEENMREALSMAIGIVNGIDLIIFRARCKE